MNGRRMRMYPDPSRKHMEVYHNFSGGLNTVTSNDNLDPSELTNLVNIDLGERGSLKRRNGFTKFLKTDGVEGKGQGFFRYYDSQGNGKFIMAIEGKLYVEDGEIEIEGLPDGFQTERHVEAVQFLDSLFIATGTELVEYDGEVAKVVEPYMPEPLEYLYIGTNALAEDPDSHIKDGEATFLRIDGVFPNKRYGIPNEETEFTFVISKPEEMSVRYAYDYRMKGESEWKEGSSYGTSKTVKFTPTSTGEYEFRFRAKDQEDSDDENVKYFHMPMYKVKEVDDEEEVDSSTMNKCNRIILYWDRLILYGDPENRQAIYISHLNNPRYFPTPNSLLFNNERNEPLTDLVKYRDHLVAFTSNTIQAVYGKDPQSFERLTINSDIGCVQPRTAKAMENSIAFLAKDGIYVLKSLGISQTRANVEKIDQRIQNIIPYGEEAHAIVTDYQYQLLFPEKGLRFRYYYLMNTWSKDESERFNFSHMESYQHEETIVQDGETGELYVFKPDVWDDDGFIYKDILETKYFDFGEPYNPKKLKEVQVLMKHFNVTVRSNLYVYADAALAIDTDKSHAVVNENGEVEWVVVNEPNLRMDAGTSFGSWELGVSPFGEIDSMVHTLRATGRCRRAKLVIMHEEATPHQFLGIGFIFKIKRP